MPKDKNLKLDQKQQFTKSYTVTIRMKKESKISIQNAKFFTPLKTTGMIIRNKTC